MANHLDTSTIQAISTAVAGVLLPILQPRQQLNVIGQSNSSQSGNETAERSVSTSVYGEHQWWNIDRRGEVLS